MPLGIMFNWNLLKECCIITKGICPSLSKRVHHMHVLHARMHIQLEDKSLVIVFMR